MPDDTPRERFFEGLENEGAVGELTGETARERFFEGFEKDMRSARGETLGQCPPVPQTTKVAAESRANYSTLSSGSNAQSYGMTGLMAVNTFTMSCYGAIRPGYVLLFPGTYEPNPPSYSGTVSLNCVAHAALLGGLLLCTHRCARSSTNPQPTSLVSLCGIRSRTRATCATPAGRVIPIGSMEAGVYP